MVRFKSCDTAWVEVFLFQSYILLNISVLMPGACVGVEATPGLETFPSFYYGTILHNTFTSTAISTELTERGGWFIKLTHSIDNGYFYLQDLVCILDPCKHHDGYSGFLRCLFTDINRSHHDFCMCHFPRTSAPPSFPNSGKWCRFCYLLWPLFLGCSYLWWVYQCAFVSSDMYGVIVVNEVHILYK